MIPEIYSEMTPVERAIIGYIITIASALFIGFLYEPFLILIVASLVFVNIGLFILPHIFPYHLGFSAGGSMMPSIPLGLTLNLSTSKIDNIEIGDVVTYTTNRNENDVHHRIIGEKESGYILKGDGNDDKDPEIVKEDQIESKSIQYGQQPVYIPISPIAIIITVAKIYKKIRGKHSKIIKEEIRIQ